MNREIKFRAWDRDNKEMVYDDLRSLVNGWDILMQYIGLKDKEGNEIYEGDIIEYEYKDLGGSIWGQKGVVEFNKGEFKAFGIQFLDGFLPPSYLSQCKVIGNKYEDNDLFEECDVNRT